MKYAKEINDIMNAFKNSPLDGKELEDYYYNGTMEFRMGNKYSSPIQDILDACKIPSEQAAFLLLGHKGCGKSTELNKMSANLKAEGYQVFTVQCARDLDMNNPLYADLLILMGEALLRIADEIGCDLNDDLRNKIKLFWSLEIEKSRIVTNSGAFSVGADVQTKSPKLLPFLQFLAGVKADLRFSKENRITYREKINHRSSEWLFIISQISDLITDKLEGKQPIIIFEDLDKINPLDAWDIFCNHAATLTGVSFPVIYTFPIALSYEPRIAALEGYFDRKTFPMVKLETMDGKVYNEGINAIIEIVKKRAELDLFNENVLDTLIQKTGGSLRDLFNAINTSAKIANRRESNTVSAEDMQIALDELKSSLTRRIERKHYSFLAEIYNGNHQKIEDKEMLLEMMHASAVLEYNGERWHDVHPLIAEFLVEQELV